MDAAKKKPALDLAVVLGGGGKDGPKPRGAMFGGDDDGDDGASEAMGGEGSDEEALPPGFAEAGEEFLDDSRPMPERLAALKRAIHACTETY